jgi:hypothetical protein
VEIRRILVVWSQPWANSFGDPILKIPSTKNRTHGVTQVVEYLPRKCKALSSNSPVPQKKEKKVRIVSQAQCCTPVIPVFKRLRQEDREFQTSLGCTVRLCHLSLSPSPPSPPKKKKVNWIFYICRFFCFFVFFRRVIFCSVIIFYVLFSPRFNSLLFIVILSFCVYVCVYIYIYIYICI